jgi:hypothetical protein
MENISLPVKQTDQKKIDKLEFVASLNRKLRSQQVVGFFEPKPRGLKSAQMWEKYMEGRRKK